MGITVSSPDGVTIEFPDGTDEETIRSVMSKAAPKPEVSTMEAAGRGALQGATFGLSDEIYAGGRGLYDAVTGGKFGETYNREIADVRAANRKAKDAAPLPFIAGEIAGGLVLPMGVAGTTARAGGAVARAGLGARTLQAAKTGAAYGGAYGFGTAEGGDGTLAEQATNRIVSALPSAAGGAVIGAVLPAAVDVGSSIVRGATNPIRAAMSPRQTAQTKVAEALLRDAPPGMAADDVVLRARGRLERAQHVNPDTILADVGGQNTRDLLRSATNLPSQGAAKTQRFLDRRQGAQWQRIEKDLADTLADGNAFSRALADVTTALKGSGSRDFAEAYAAPFNVKASDPLASFIMNRGYVQKVLQKTQTSIEGMTGDDIAKMSPWELLHRAKMEIDKQIGKLKNGQGDPADNWSLADLSQLMGEANPKFLSAMDRYGDIAGVRTALEDGFENFAKLRWRDLADEMTGLTRIEKSMYRLGAARSLFQEIERGNIMRDRTENIFSSPDMMKKLAVLFPDRAARRDFQRRLVIHARQADTRKAVQGNSTTARQLAQGQEAGQVAAPVQAAITGVDALSGRYGQALSYLSRQVQRFHGMTPAVADQIVSTMMAKGALGPMSGIMAAVEKAAREPAFRAQMVDRIMKGMASGYAGGKSESEPRNAMAAYRQ